VLGSSLDPSIGQWKRCRGGGNNAEALGARVTLTIIAYVHTRIPFFFILFHTHGNNYTHTGGPEIAQMLLEKGAKPNILDLNGVEPSMCQKSSSMCQKRVADGLTGLEGCGWEGDTGLTAMDGVFGDESAAVSLSISL